MGKKVKIITGVIVVFALLLVGAYLLKDANFAVLQPRGTIGESEKDILLFGAALSLIVVLPVFALTFFIVYKYRATNKKAKYQPNWDHHKGLETIWWGVPIVLMIILSIVTWQSSHALDPFKPLESSKKPITIEVVALQWKWLFIYPEQNIAVVNLTKFPVDTPINFVITSDAPMNSFWIPQLGGQIYAMSGMSTKLHLMATQAGSYNGVSANLSGKGFSGMRFDANATSDQDFTDWVYSAKQAPNRLSLATYTELAEASQDHPVTYYSSVDEGLYDTIMMKYTTPTDDDIATQLKGMAH